MSAAASPPLAVSPPGPIRSWFDPNLFDPVLRRVGALPPESSTSDEYVSQWPHLHAASEQDVLRLQSEQLLLSQDHVVVHLWERAIVPFIELAVHCHTIAAEAAAATTASLSSAPARPVEPRARTLTSEAVPPPPPAANARALQDAAVRAMQLLRSIVATAAEAKALAGLSAELADADRLGPPAGGHEQADTAGGGGVGSLARDRRAGSESGRRGVGHDADDGNDATGNGAGGQGVDLESRETDATDSEVARSAGADPPPASAGGVVGTNGHRDGDRATGTENGSGRPGFRSGGSTPAAGMVNTPGSRPGASLSFRWRSPEAEAIEEMRRTQLLARRFSSSHDHDDDDYHNDVDPSSGAGADGDGGGARALPNTAGEDAPHALFMFSEPRPSVAGRRQSSSSPPSAAVATATTTTAARARGSRATGTADCSHERRLQRNLQRFVTTSSFRRQWVGRCVWCARVTSLVPYW
jgi:hypothetical protein